MSRTVLALAALGIVGCAPSSLQLHARAATLTAGVLTTGGAAVDAAREAAYDRVEAQYPEDPEHDEQLTAERARWQPVHAALDTARSTLLTWVAAIEAAHWAGDNGLLATVAPIAARLVLLYDEVVRLTRSLGATELPELPPLLRQLAQGFGGGR